MINHVPSNRPTGPLKAPIGRGLAPAGPKPASPTTRLGTDTLTLNAVNAAEPASPAARERARASWQDANPNGDEDFYRTEISYRPVNDPAFADVLVDVNQPGAAEAYRRFNPPRPISEADIQADQANVEAIEAAVAAYPASEEGVDQALADANQVLETLAPQLDAKRASTDPAERRQAALIDQLEKYSNGNPRVMATALKMAQAGDWEGVAGLRGRYAELAAFAERETTEANRAVAQDGLDQLAANRPAEEAALAKLTPADRARFDKLAKLAEHNPHARLALGLHLIEGKLTGETNAKGETLLAALAKVADQPLAGGLDRAELVNGLLRETANPASIAQKGYNTCTVTAVQILTAERAPAEYVRLVGGLSTPEGKVQLADGHTLQRNKGTARDDGSGRTASARLWQAAMMEYGNEAGRAVNGRGRYDNRADVNRYDGNRKEAHAGFNDTAQIDRVLDGIFGHNVETFWVNGDDAALGKVREALAAGRPVPVAMQWGGRNADGQVHGGHQLVLKGYENGEAILANPWGKVQRMPVEDFERRLIWASVDGFKVTARR